MAVSEMAKSFAAYAEAAPWQKSATSRPGGPNLTLHASDMQHAVAHTSFDKIPVTDQAGSVEDVTPGFTPAALLMLAVTILNVPPLMSSLCEQMTERWFREGTGSRP